ncbi:hypothetical protein OROHE_006212 [Orobanche hederae]
MGDDINSSEISSQESSPTSVFPSKEVDQPSGTHPTAQQDTDGKTDTSESAGDQMERASEEDKEPPETHENSVAAILESEMTGNIQNIEVKIVARPSPEDDHLPLESSPQARNGTISQLSAKVETNSKNHQNPTLQAKVPNNDRMNRGQIDTAPPFESVKAAVSKFGGIVDWKAHREQAVERRKIIEQELEKAQDQIPLCKKQLKDAEEAKLQVRKELDTTKRLVEELKLSLERAQTEEQQARQDSELAKLRVEEIEQGIADEASFAAKAQLEVARARHAAALSELKFVKDELETLKEDHTLLLAEKDASVKKAEEAISKSKEIEKSAGDLTIELITTKESLESAHAAHLEAEEHRIGAVMAKEQDILNWEKELKQMEDELEKVTKQISASDVLKSKLDKASVLLQDLKNELAAYMESKFAQEGNNSGNNTRVNIEAALLEAKKELGEVMLDLESATKEVNILKVAAVSLNSELEKEKMELAAIRQREGMAGIAVSSLESELSRTKLEISRFQMKEKEEREKCMELPKKLQEAAQEADKEKALSEIARDDLRKAKDEVERVKAGTNTVESRLCAARKEIEAAKASEKLALAAISALVESESVQKNGDENQPAGVTLALEKYYELSRRAHEAEEQANVRVADALFEVEVAKESELRSLKMLEEANREMAEKMAGLEIALQKAEKAKEGKLAVEQELRKWRAEHEQRRKSGGVSANLNKSPKLSVEKLESKNSAGAPNSTAPHHLMSSPKSYTSNMETNASPFVRVISKKKKKSLFPKILMFLGRNKSHALSKS